ncbi:hypothetical protein SLEP1_g6646 [Rubroshorea leprosula]|uniref:Uncharacterized protein n=1 Tax=Rubroshorea leprosula TaxID=152421 RepID=A0AAV5I531_9ROSI|nr:hypothetical protein SLEP1_g6646 [Rubroshorea leprosula]
MEPPLPPDPTQSAHALPPPPAPPSSLAFNNTAAPVIYLSNSFRAADEMPNGIKNVSTTSRCIYSDGSFPSVT